MLERLRGTIRPDLIEITDAKLARQEEVAFLKGAIVRFHEQRRDSLLPFMAQVGISTGRLLSPLKKTNETGMPVHGRYIRPRKSPIRQEKLGQMTPSRIILQEEERMLDGYEHVKARWYSLRKMGFGDLVDVLGMEDFGFSVIANAKDLKQRKRKGVAKENWGRALTRANNIIFWNAGWSSENGIWRNDPARFVDQNQGTISIVVTPPGYGRNSWQKGKMEQIIDSGLYTKQGLSFIMTLFKEMLDIRKRDNRRIINVVHSQNGARVLELPRHELARRNQAWVVLSPAIFCKALSLGHYGILEHLMGVGGRVPAIMSKPVAGEILQRLTENVDPEVIAVHQAVVEDALERVGAEGLTWAMDDLYETQGSIRSMSWPRNVVVFFGNEDPLVDSDRARDFLIRAGIKTGKIIVFDGLGHYFWLQTRGDDTEREISSHSHRHVMATIRGFLRQPKPHDKLK